MGGRKKTKKKKGGTLSRSLEKAHKVPEEYSKFFTKLDEDRSGLEEDEAPVNFNTQEAINPLTFEEFVQNIKDRNDMAKYNLINLDELGLVSSEMKNNLDELRDQIKLHKADPWPKADPGLRLGKIKGTGDRRIGLNMRNAMRNARARRRVSDEKVSLDEIKDMLDTYLPTKSKEIYTQILSALPELREKNLKIDYESYLSSMDVIRTNMIPYSKKKFNRSLAQHSSAIVQQKLLGRQQDELDIMNKFTLNDYIKESWEQLWTDLLYESYIESIVDKMIDDKDVNDITRINMISTIKTELDSNKNDLFTRYLPEYDPIVYIELLKLHN